MVRFLIASVFPAVTAGVGAALVASWLAGAAPMDLELREPAAAQAGWAVPPEPPVDLKGFFAAGEGQAADLRGAWPGFRGADRDAVSKEPIRFGPSWPPAGPPVLWSVALGEGYGGAAVADGRVYLLDYDQQNKADTLRCLSLEDGKEIWRRGYRVLVKRNHGMSRTVPAVGDGYVVTIGPRCHVLCADAATGEFRWGIDLVKEYGATEPDWYTGQCPLIDNGRAILAPGGNALMIAVDCASGKVLWRTPNPRHWRMTHSSIVPMTVGGERIYLYCASGGLAGVSAETGELLWLFDAWTVTMANSPSPVVVGDGRVFLCGGYHSGAMMVQVEKQGQGFAVRPLFRLEARDFGSEQQTPVLYEDRLYGVREDGQLVCLDLQGKVLWTSGRTHRFGDKGRGPYVIAGGELLVLDGEDGKLSRVAARGDGFRLLGQWQVLTGEEPWGPAALAGGRLLVRDLTRMVCLDVSAGASHD